MPGRLRPVVLTGPNGAGKTNLLEAMSFLSPGRGLRNARLSDIDRRDAGAAEPAASGLGGRGDDRDRGAAPVAIGTGRDRQRGGRAPRGPHRRRAGARPGGARPSGSACCG